MLCTLYFVYMEFVIRNELFSEKWEVRELNFREMGSWFLEVSFLGREMRTPRIVNFSYFSVLGEISRSGPHTETIIPQVRIPAATLAEGQGMHVHVAFHTSTTTVQRTAHLWTTSETYATARLWYGRVLKSVRKLLNASWHRVHTAVTVCMFLD